MKLGTRSIASTSASDAVPRVASASELGSATISDTPTADGWVFLRPFTKYL